VADQSGYVGMGGRSDDLNTRLRDAYKPDLPAEEAARIAVRTLSEAEERPIEVGNLEAAVLDRTRGRRKFRRLGDPELGQILQAQA
jgi:proteasome alpha subunit